MRHALFLGVLLLLTCGCRPGVAEPLLSYLVESEAGATWHLWDGALGQSRVFLELPQAPQQTFWNPAARTVTFVNGATYRASYDALPAQPKRLGPAPNGLGDVIALWREETTGRLRAVTHYWVPDQDVIGDPDDPTYRLPDGSEMPGRADPKWLSYNVCTLQELSPAGTWVTLEQVADGWGYEGTPCIVLDFSKRREAGVSQFALFETYICARGYGDRPAQSELCLEEPPPAVNALFESFMRTPAGKLVRVPDKRFGVLSYLRPSGVAHGLAYGVTAAHALHIDGAIFLVTPEEGTVELLDLTNEWGSQLGVDGSFVVIAEEHSGVDPTVVDLARGRIVFQAKGRDALWVPR